MKNDITVKDEEPYHRADSRELRSTQVPLPTLGNAFHFLNFGAVRVFVYVV